MVEKTRFSFKGWNLAEFAKGRKKLLVTLIGAFATFVVTNKPELSAMVGALSELLFAAVEYFVKEYDNA